jgi:hypothetical protein
MDMGAPGGVVLAASLHPVAVVPLVIEVPDDGRGRGRLLVHEAERVGLVHAEAVVARLDVVLVAGAPADAGHEGFPDAGCADGMQRCVRLPVVEVADDADAFGVGRPDGEVGAVNARRGARVRAELQVQPVVRALVEQVQVVLA